MWADVVASCAFRCTGMITLHKHFCTNSTFNRYPDRSFLLGFEFLPILCWFLIYQVVQHVEAVETTPGPTTTTTSTTPRPPYVYTYDKNQVINEILSVRWTHIRIQVHNSQFKHAEINDGIVFFLLFADSIPCTTSGKWNHQRQVGWRLFHSKNSLLRLNSVTS